MRVVLAGLLAFACVGCGADASAPAPGAEGLFRLDLRGSSTELTVESVTFVHSGELPPAMGGGDYLVVAYSRGEPVEVRPLRFASSLLAEGEEGDREEVPLDLAPETIFVDARNGVDRIDILGADGAVIETIAELPALPGSEPGMRTEPLLADEFPTIRVLGPTDSAPSPAYFDGLLEPMPEWEQRVAAGLRRLPPPVRLSVRAVGWAEFNPDAAVRFGAVTCGSTIIFNDLHRSEESLARLTVHEGAHVFTNLVDDATTLLGASGYPPGVSELAEQLARSAQLRNGLTAGWANIHDTGVAVGAASPYAGDGWMSTANPVASGFATAYGSANAKEDIAEYVETILAADVHSDPGACPILRSAGELSPEIALPYAKLSLLRYTGMLPEAAFDSCVGSISLDGPEGIHVPDAISFSSALQVGWLDVNGYNFFAVAGDGPDTYRILIQVYAPDEAAVGLHRLDLVASAGSVDDTINAIFLAHDDPDFARASAGGLMLVSEINDTHAIGALFFVSLRGALSITDRWPYATFKIPR